MDIQRTIFIIIIIIIIVVVVVIIIHFAFDISFSRSD
jgi:preprotein translocase subunit SecE